MKFLTKNKHWNITEEYNIDKLLYLLIDRPDYFTNHHSRWHKNKDIIHRNYDLPAMATDLVLLEWCINGELCRDNNKKYVRLWDDGYKEYWDDVYKHEIFSKKINTIYQFFSNTVL